MGTERRQQFPASLQPAGSRDPFPSPALMLALLRLATLAVATAAEPRLRLGFLDPALPQEPPRRNAAALAFAQTVAEVTRLKPLAGGSWLDQAEHLRAPEEFDALWFHQGDDPAAALLPEPSSADLLAYLEQGGVLLVSGAAGRLVNELGLDPTPVRVLGPTEVAYVSGVVVLGEHRDHPAFAGLEVSQPILLTSKGGNALADFYDTPGPAGELLADGNAGVGERPLVEYAVGEGRVIFVGWRLPDFTTAGDAHRPNLERLLRNLLGYLVGRGRNQATLVPPSGKAEYVRQLGVPFLRAPGPQAFVIPTGTAKTVVAMLPGDGSDGANALAADGVRLLEIPLPAATATVQALALTLTGTAKPASAFLARRRAEQAESDRLDRERIGNLRVIKPEVKLVPAPLQPRTVPVVDQSVLLGRSAFMAPGEGRGDAKPAYEPVEDGGFRIARSRRQFNRPIVHGQNRVWTGDVPLFRMDTVTGNGSYASQERVFPLWPRPDAHIGEVNPCLGALRLGVRGADGKVAWLEAMPAVTATFRPGYTEYEVAESATDGWKASVVIAPAFACHGLICRIEFDRELPLVWRYGGVWWQSAEANANRVDAAGNLVRIREPNLPEGLVLAGWDAEGPVTVVSEAHGQVAEFAGTVPRRVYHVVAAWGVNRVDEARLKTTLARLDTPAAAGWPAKRDQLKELWLDCYIRRALDPETHFRSLLADPAGELARTRRWWDQRRQEFQVRTPDPHLNALANWARCTSEYHRQGPGLVLGAQIWQMYSHISTGWYGKQWGGDHQAIEECLRFYAAMQNPDGFIRWISPSLVAFHAENNTPYWVDQVWRHYTWTGDREFVRDLWPNLRLAVRWLQQHNDPDGDGLFRDWYEYWNCDSNGKGPKAAAPTAMAWAAFDRAARLAAVVQDTQAATEYQAQADKIRTAVFRELWREDAGRLGSIGADGLWWGHPQVWEEYLAANAGLLTPEQSRSALRWVASHYGFEPQPGVHLLSCSDWWPIRWSVQWVPTGDTCLAVLAGLRSGDAEVWWPYLRTVIGSAFRSDFPGINMGIANSGAGGGDREDVDSTDPHTHVVVRGLFGVEPALPERELRICPGFPAAWRQASIRTPDFSYEYRCDDGKATFRIRTPKPLAKRVRANLTGAEVVTPVETDSVVTVALGPAVESPQAPARPTILAEQQPPPAPEPLPAEARTRLVLFDLAAASNVSLDEFTTARFIFDYADHPQPLSSWWGNPVLRMAPAPRLVETANGVLLLTSGRPRVGAGPGSKNLLALSSWRPYPFPAGAAVPVGFRCEQVWLLLQSYVHPMKNYLPNGEVIVRYTTGNEQVVPLVPPFNLDCYFQHFSREGVQVPFGVLGPWPAGWTPIHAGLATAHADALAVRCDPAREIEAIELRATCSEGVLGLAGLTALAAP